MSLSFPASPTVGQQYGNWTWNGTSWDPTPAAVQSGTPILIASQTVSAAVATVDFLTGIGDGTYDEYELRLYDLLVATETVLQMRVSTDGATFDTGSNYIWTWVNGNTTAAAVGAGGISAGGIQLGPAHGISTQFAYYGVIRFFISKVTRPSCTWQVQSHNSSAAYSVAGAGEYAATIGPNVIKGFRFFATSGNITRGTFRVFGISRQGASPAQSVTPTTVGGNKFRNGTMDIWQRTLSGLLSSAPSYTADGWIVSGPASSATLVYSTTSATTAPGNYNATMGVSGGGLTVTSPASTASVTTPTALPTGGKFYWEVTAGTVGGLVIGIVPSGHGLQTYAGAGPTAYAVNMTNGNKINNNVSTAYGSTALVGYVLGIALDQVNGAIWFSMNGVWLGSATLAEIVAGTTTHAAYTGIVTTTPYFPTISNSAGVASGSFSNFGATPFAFQPPAGFIAPQSYGNWSQVAGRGPTINALKLGGQTNTTDMLVKQRIESYIATPMTSQQITVQAQVHNDTGGAITPTLTVKHPTARDNYASTVTDVNAVSMQSCANGAWTQIAYTFTDAGSANLGLEITIDFGNNFNAASKSVTITELDCRVTPSFLSGLNSIPQPAELRPYPSELALCQRYLETSYDQYVAPGAVTNNGGVFGYNNFTTVGSYSYGRNEVFAVPKRAAPTMQSYSPVTGGPGKVRELNSNSDLVLNWQFTGARSFSWSTGLTTTASVINPHFHFTANAEL